MKHVQLTIQPKSKRVNALVITRDRKYPDKIVKQHSAHPRLVGLLRGRNERP